MNRAKVALAVLLVAVVGVSAFFALQRADDKSTKTANNKTSQGSTPTPSNGASANQSQSIGKEFNKSQYSLTDPKSLWVIANKQRPLNPKDYAPQLVTPKMALRLQPTAAEMKVSTAMKADLESMDAAAKQAGLSLMLASGYRSYQTQVAVYNNEVKTYGQAMADRESARPGFSEHQTGLAADLAPASGTCVVEDCFATTPEGKWVAEHAYEYGFVIRYQNGQEAVTGYRYEPWHVRYIGKALAAELHKQGNPVLETFFGLPAAPNYAQ